MNVREIFRLKGEDHFRAQELALTKELSGTGGMVLSPGGGWITQRSSVELLRSAGRIIYLRASPEAVARRLKRVETLHSLKIFWFSWEFFFQGEADSMVRQLAP